MHVHEVEGAFRTRERVDRAEAFVGRGHELLLVVERRSLDQALVGIEHQSLHEITGGLADERVAIGIGREEVGTIDPRSAGGGAFLQFEVTEHLRAIAAVDAGVHARGPDGLLDGGLGVEARVAAEIRVAKQVARIDHVDAQEVAVVIGIQAAVVVLRQAPLPAEGAVLADPLAVDGLEAGRVGAGVEPAIVPPKQRVRGAFRVGELRTGRIDAHAKVRRDLRLLIGLTVAVRIAAEPEVRRGADESTIAVQHQRARQDDVIEEDRALIHTAVAVGIAEHDHRALGLGFRRAVEVFHVARHLHDPEAAVGSELQDRRVADQRSFGDKFDAVARGDLEAAQRLFSRERR